MRVEFKNDILTFAVWVAAFLLLLAVVMILLPLPPHRDAFSATTTPGHDERVAVRLATSEGCINQADHAETMAAEVERLRESLAVWIEKNTHHPIDAAVSIAMLETAFDRYIVLLGPTHAFELVEACFRRRAEKFRRSLQ